MSSILDLLNEYEVRRFDIGETVIKEGECSGLLYFLIEGAVEVRKDEVLLFATSQPGTVFGELSTLLGGNHHATVNAVRPCAFYIVTNPRTFLATSPAVCFTCAKRLRPGLTRCWNTSGTSNGSSKITIILEWLIRFSKP